MFARRADPSGSVSVVLEWRDAADRLLARDASPPLTSVGAWAQLAVTGSAPRNAAYVRIDLVARGIAARVWFDDVVFNRQ